jgi:hypothetical protein
MRQTWSETEKRMPNSSILRRLLAYVVQEHVCYPPDSSTDWVAISASRHDHFANVYLCPECGQRFARVRYARMDAGLSTGDGALEADGSMDLTRRSAA